MVQINQPKSERSATVKLAIQAALAGALASGTSTAAMHPLDTLKTRVQTTVGKGPGMKAFLKTIPEIGAKGLYRGYHSRGGRRGFRPRVPDGYVRGGV